MNRLIRAEGYRLLHSGVYLRILLFSGLVLSVLPMMTDFSLLDKSLAENMESFLSGSTMSIMFVPIVIAVFVVTGYMKKTAYYEVMTGNKIRSIIGSKLFVDGIIVGVIYFFFTIVLPATVVMKNGTSGVTQLPLRAFLLFVICLHVTMLAVLMGLTVKNIAAAAVVYLRFMLLDIILAELLPMLFEKWNVSEEVSVRIARCTFTRQMSEVFRTEISTELVVITLASFLIEVGIWYGITYLTMKKKWYK